jgi:hypothetical protein
VAQKDLRKEFTEAVKILWHISDQDKIFSNRIPRSKINKYKYIYRVFHDFMS